MVSYSFIADLSFYRAALGRYSRQKPHRTRNIAVIAILTALLLAAWVYGHSSHAIWTSIPQLALIGGLSGGIAAFAGSRILVPLRLKRSPGFGATVTVTLDDKGLHASEPHGQTSLDWAAFTRVVRFADGLALLRGRVIRWLPDSALTSGSPEEALALARSKTNVVGIG